MTSSAEVSPADTAQARWAPVSLADLVERVVDHHRIPVPVDRRLRLGAVVGLAAIAALTVVAAAGAPLRDASRPAVLLFGWPALRWVLWGQPQNSVAVWAGSVIFVSGALGAALTRGFARVRPSLLVAVFALVVLGWAAGVPLLVAGMILLANIATWAALGALCLLAAAAVIFALIAGLGQQ